MDSLTSKVLWHKFIQSETKKEYQEGLNYLLEKDFEIQSVTIDGRRGIPFVFNKYPIQICQFHIQKRILARTTKNPKTDCGKRLKYIANHFISQRWNKQKFTTEIKNILEEFKDFLSERNEQNHYQHKQLRSAFFGIKLALPYLFTFQDYPDLNINNTTNSIDGGVNTKLKELNRIHRGMKIERRNKLLINLLYNLRGKVKNRTLKNVL